MSNHFSHHQKLILLFSENSASPISKEKMASDKLSPYVRAWAMVNIKRKFPHINLNADPPQFLIEGNESNPGTWLATIPISEAKTETIHFDFADFTDELTSIRLFEQEDVSNQLVEWGKFAAMNFIKDSYIQGKYDLLFHFDEKNKDDENRWSVEICYEGVRIALIEKETYNPDSRPYHKRMARLSVIQKIIDTKINKILGQQDNTAHETVELEEGGNPFDLKSYILTFFEDGVERQTKFI
jgi:hypothetical protein